MISTSLKALIVGTAILLTYLAWLPQAHAKDASTTPAGGVLAALPTVSSDELAKESGKNAVFGIGNVGQDNTAIHTNKNESSPIITGAGATKTNGSISPSSVNGNQGIVMFTQNTGDVVNISKSLNVNVYLK